MTTAQVLVLAAAAVIVLGVAYTPGRALRWWLRFVVVVLAVLVLLVLPPLV